MKKDCIGDQKETSLDAEKSVLARLGLTLTLLPIFLIVTVWYFALEGCANPWCRIVGQVACEIVLSFVAIAFVFVWWRPKWLRQLYLAAERKASYLLAALILIGFLSLAWAVFSLLLN